MEEWAALEASAVPQVEVAGLLVEGRQERELFGVRGRPADRVAIPNVLRVICDAGRGSLAANEARIIRDFEAALKVLLVLVLIVDVVEST
jgi:hypothetical protein